MFPFTTIIVTNPDEASAEAAHELLDSTLKKHLQTYHPAQTSDVRVISTCDPFGARCGSGGGTLAALELLSSQPPPNHDNDNNGNGNGDDNKGRPVLHQQHQETVLCLHAGGDSSRCPLSMILGKAWTSLPSSKYRNPTIWLIHQLELLFHKSKIPKGSLVVAATDCLISFGPQLEDYDVDDDDNTNSINSDIVDPWTVLGVAVPAPLNTAKNHGVYIMPESVLPQSLSSSSSSSSSSTINVKEGMSTRFNIATPVDVWQKPTLTQLLGEKESTTNKNTKSSVMGVDQSSLSKNNLSSEVTPSSPSCFDITGRDGKQAWIDVGIVIFYPKAFDTLLQLADGILSKCTRKGLEAAYNTNTNSNNNNNNNNKNDDDENNTTTKVSSSLSLETYAKQNALKIDLYTDILHNIPRTKQLQTPTTATTTTIADDKVVMSSEDDNAAATPNSHSLQQKNLEHALSNLLLKVLVAPNGSFLHLGTTQELVDFITIGSNPECGYSIVATTEVGGGGDGVGKTIDLIVTQTVAKALDMNSRFLAWIDDDDDRDQHSRLRKQQHSTSKDHSNICTNVALCSTFPGNNNKKSDVGNVMSVTSNTRTTAIGQFSFVEYCDLKDFASISVGDQCMLSGWRKLQNVVQTSADNSPTTLTDVTEALIIPDSLSVQLLPIQQHDDDVNTNNNNNMESTSDIENEEFVYMVLGTKDGTKTPLLSSTIYGIPFSDFMEWTGVTVVDLGFEDGSLYADSDCLWNAKIHPIVHPEQQSSMISFSSLFGWIENARTGNMSSEDDDSLRRWLSSTRVSLKDLHGIADASKEWAYRNALEDKVAPLHRHRSVSKISTLLRTRCQDEPCDVGWLMDLHDGPTAWDALGHFIDSLGRTACDELEQGNYDICGRAFMLASATLADFDIMSGRGGGQLEKDEANNAVATNCAELVKKLKLSSTKPMSKSDRIQIIQEILHQQRSCLGTRVSESCRVCSEIMEHLALVMVEFTVADSFRRFLDPEFPDIIHITRMKEPVYNSWVLTTAPARVDLAGT
jgi:hypothetical protein